MRTFKKTAATVPQVAGAPARFSPRPFAAVQRRRVPGQDVTAPVLAYEVDGQNRPRLARGLIAMRPGTARSGSAQAASWDSLANLKTLINKPAWMKFHGGHLIARHFGGDPGLMNMVPMPGVYNSQVGDGGYKDFENSLDVLLEGVLSGLRISIEVAYPDPSYAFIGLLSDQDDQLLISRQPVAEHLGRVFSAIPRALQIDVRTPAGDPVGGIALPLSPWEWLRRAWAANGVTLNRRRQNWTLEALQSESNVVEVPVEDVDPYDLDAEETQILPYGEWVAKTYDERIQSGKMPRPGVFDYHTDGTLASGVDAFIFMDPKWTLAHRYGGTDASDAVDPAGANWELLRRARRRYDRFGNPDPDVGDNLALYKKGHLLTALLHGPGHDPRNLVPITASANTRMSTQFEDVVKVQPALTDPDRGILYHARTFGHVARPPDHNPGPLDMDRPLFEEEAKMPKGIHLFAYEAVQDRDEDGTIRSMRHGGLVAQAMIWNTFPEDPAGPYLDKTYDARRHILGAGVPVPGVDLAKQIPQYQRRGETPHLLRFENALSSSPGWSLLRGLKSTLQRHLEAGNGPGMVTAWSAALAEIAERRLKLRQAFALAGENQQARQAVMLKFDKHAARILYFCNRTDATLRWAAEPGDAPVDDNPFYSAFLRQYQTRLQVREIAIRLRGDVARVRNIWSLLRNVVRQGFTGAV